MALNSNTKWQIHGEDPAVVAMEIRNGEIAHVRHYIDKLEGGQQITRGTLTRWIIGRIAKRVETLINLQKEACGRSTEALAF